MRRREKGSEDLHKKRRNYKNRELHKLTSAWEWSLFKGIPSYRDYNSKALAVSVTEARRDF